MANEATKKAAVISLIDDILTFVVDSAEESIDPVFQMRARVLIARLDRENKQLEKREKLSNQELAAELGVQHGDD